MASWYRFLMPMVPCDPLEFIQMINAMDEQAADIVLGSRLGKDSEMPRIRRIGNVLFAQLLGFAQR